MDTMQREYWKYQELTSTAEAPGYLPQIDFN